MNLGASMVAKRVRQDELREANVWRGFLIGVPVAVALWVAIIYLAAAIFG